MITLQTKDLKAALQEHKRVIPTGTNITTPILSYVLIQAKRKLVKITSTDLDTTLSLNLNSETIENFESVIRLSELQKVANNIKTDTLTLAPEKEEIESKKPQAEGEEKPPTQINYYLVARAGKLKVKLQALEPENFSALPALKDQEYINLKIDIDDLKFVMSTTAKEETMYAVPGVKIEMRPKVIRLVSTDGHRLSVSERETHHEKELRLLLPLSALKAISNYKDVFLRAVTEEHVIFECPDSAGTTIIARKAGGRFPDYKQVTPDRWNVMIIIETAKLKEGLSQVLPFCEGRNYGACFTLTNGKLRISTDEHAETEAFTDIETSAIPSPGFNLGWNASAKYFMEVTKWMPKTLGLQIKLNDDKTVYMLRFSSEFRSQIMMTHKGYAG